LKDGIRKLIKDTEETYKDSGMSSLVLWEILKIKIREYCIRYSVGRGKTQKQARKLLQVSLDNVSRRLEQDSTNQELLAEKHKYEMDLLDLYDKEAKGYQIRSRAKWVEEGERSTSYFLRLEQKHQGYNRITQLEDKEGDLKTDDIEILEVPRDYYKKLYTSVHRDKSDIRNHLDNINVPTLSDNDKYMCDQEISCAEIEEAIKCLKYDKSPGLDGLRPEFYKEFYKDLMVHLKNLFEEIFVKGEMPTTMRQAVLSLIHKKVIGH